MYINKLTMINIIRTNNRSISFENFDNKTLQQFCYTFLEEYNKLLVLYKLEVRNNKLLDRKKSS